VELRAIEVSRTIGDKWLVENGLKAGDQVIVQGLQKIRPGIPVRITDANAPEPTPPAKAPAAPAAGSAQK
jgi:membrane fusion protein (multidrug efflux system)